MVAKKSKNRAILERLIPIRMFCRLRKAGRRVWIFLYNGVPPKWTSQRLAAMHNTRVVLANGVYLLMLLIENTEIGMFLKAL